MAGRKRSKKWCKSGWDVPIWEKFEEDAEKRVQMPKIKIKCDDVAYINEAAHRRGVTCSRMFETILDRYFFSKMSEKVMILPNTMHGLRYYETRNCPKWSVHPSYLELLTMQAKKRRHSLVVMLSEIMIVYKNRFPKSIREEYRCDS